MVNGWENDKCWADGYLDTVKCLLGRHLIGSATKDDDQLRNTDLIVLKLEVIRVAVRIRKPQYFTPQFAPEFTIRASRPGGTETELNKIIAGWGDYFFYGFAEEQPGRLLGWTLGDLKIFRAWFSCALTANGQPPGRAYSNTDRSSTFRVFRWADLPADFIIAQRLKIAEPAIPF